MASQILKQFLDDQHIKYVSIKHSPAYTAQEIAEIVHISAKEFAKTVIVRLDNCLAMVVVPGHHRVDFNTLKKVTGAKSADLASEVEFKERFPDCELGAMPPFGNLFDMKVYVDHKLSDDAQIAFNAGTHSELIKLAYKDFAELVKPQVINL